MLSRDIVWLGPQLFLFHQYFYCFGHSQIFTEETRLLSSPRLITDLVRCSSFSFRQPGQDIWWFQTVSLASTSCCFASSPWRLLRTTSSLPWACFTASSTARPFLRVNSSSPRYFSVPSTFQYHPPTFSVTQIFQYPSPRRDISLIRRALCCPGSAPHITAWPLVRVLSSPLGLPTSKHWSSFIHTRSACLSSHLPALDTNGFLVCQTSYTSVSSSHHYCEYISKSWRYTQPSKAPPLSYAPNSALARWLPCF